MICFTKKNFGTIRNTTQTIYGSSEQQIYISLLHQKSYFWLEFARIQLYHAGIYSNSLELSRISLEFTGIYHPINTYICIWNLFT